MSKSTSTLLKKKWTISDIPDQNGKIILITGANSGLGLASSIELVKKGATVIMTARNVERGNNALQEIKNEISNADVELMILDLSSLKSVKKFADAFKLKYDKLDVLMNNAGVMQPPRMETEDGFELQIGVNHLGHFALTSYLFELIEKTNGKIINQSSIAAKYGKINFNDLNSIKRYSRSGAYSQSKLANLLFTYELDKRIKEQNKNVLSLAVHPGWTKTELQFNGPNLGGKSMWSRFYSVVNKIMAQDLSMGILPMLYAITTDDVHGGDYIGPKKFGGTRGYPARIKSVKRSYKMEDWVKFWKLSEDLVNTKFL